MSNMYRVINTSLEAYRLDYILTSTSFGPKAIRSRSTLVAGTTDHIGFALALSTSLVTHVAE